jgi:ABC-2 type transport system permease protein
MTDTVHITGRHFRAFLRQPWWVAVALVQPVIWLLLYGALFKRIVDIPGFHGGSYITFLAPGVVVMTALFSAGWGGMSTMNDVHSGVLDRFLVSPVRRSALIVGPLLSQVINVVVQTAIIVGLALLVGASFPGGAAGVLALTVVSVLLAFAFGALSHGLALAVRREETLIAAMQFLLLPLTFLSTAFMQASLIPGWIRHVSDVNPVNWAVVAGRAATQADPDWGLVASRAGLLLALALACAAFATRAFRSYQASV